MWIFILCCSSVCTLTLPSIDPTYKPNFFWYNRKTNIDVCITLMKSIKSKLGY
ncbi:hypothetical protein HanXRQr2_Chr01g0011131 [Helianthus annuus]|uniref:Uncharacterized protein n=1 Tax=Helianthus annuus TaxID=4232 RepID=A0A9K3JTU1_HELAN|nr:hypothetical protein HanXRQr2_Chr01g0011131 [Helianthus annuus]